jgi:hypothetical protein
LTDKYAKRAPAWTRIKYCTAWSDQPIRRGELEARHWRASNMFEPDRAFGKIDFTASITGKSVDTELGFAAQTELRALA